MRGNKILERLTVKDSNTPHSCDYRYMSAITCLIISRVNSPPLGAYEKSKKELQYPAACGGVVYCFQSSNYSVSPHFFNLEVLIFSIWIGFHLAVVEILGLTLELLRLVYTVLIKIKNKQKSIASIIYKELFQSRIF